jgi:hypothetical protein
MSPSRLTTRRDLALPGLAAGAAALAGGEARAAERGGLASLLAGLAPGRTESLETYAQIAGIRLGRGNDQPAFDAAMAAMRRERGLYVRVPPGSYKARSLRLHNRSGFVCDPRTVVLEQLPPAPGRRWEPFVALADPLASHWVFYGFTLRGGWPRSGAERWADAARQDGLRADDSPGPQLPREAGHVGVHLHGAFSGEADMAYRANSPSGAQNPRGRLGELEIEGFAGDGLSLRGAGAQVFGPIQVYRVGGRGAYVDTYDCKFGFIDVGETGLEGLVFGPNGSANIVTGFKAWYAGGRRVAGHTAALRLDRSSGLQLSGQLQDPSGPMVVAEGVRGCTAVLGVGWQGRIDQMDQDIAALELSGDSRANTFVLNAAIGPYASQAYPGVKRLLRMKPAADGARPTRNTFVVNHEGWPGDAGVWNDAWFQGPLDGNLLLVNDQVRQPGQWAPLDDGRITFGLAEPGGLGMIVGGKVSAQPGQVILVHHDTARIDHFADGVYSSALVASKDAVTLGVPLRLKSYTVATVPNAVAAGAGAAIYVVDEIGGAQGAKSDGKVWRRDSDRAVIRKRD